MSVLDEASVDCDDEASVDGDDEVAIEETGEDIIDWPGVEGLEALHLYSGFGLKMVLMLLLLLMPMLLLESLQLILSADVVI